MDLDQLIRAEFSAQAERAPDAAAVLAGVPARARARRQRRAVLGAVAAAALLAAAVPVTALRPDPAPPTTHQPPSDADVLRSCLGRAPALLDRPPTQGRVLVTLADDRGYAAWVGGGDYDLPDCMFDRSGAPAGGPATKLYPRGVRPPRGYLPDGTPYALQDGGVGDGGRSYTTAYASGRVSRQVRRLVIRWPRLPPAEAVLDGPYFLARVSVDGVLWRPADRPESVTAYDGAGRVLGRTGPGAPITQVNPPGAVREPAAGTRPGVVPAAPVLLAACTADASGAPAVPGARVLAVHRDARGFVVWVGGDTVDLPDCAFRWDGRPDGGPSSSRTADGRPLPRGHLRPGAGATVEHVSGTGGEPDPDAGSRETVRTAAGRVSADVRRVVVRWAGAPAVTATVTGPFWLARVWRRTTSADLDTTPVVEAYDGAGRLLSGG